MTRRVIVKADEGEVLVGGRARFPVLLDGGLAVGQVTLRLPRVVRRGVAFPADLEFELVAVPGPVVDDELDFPLFLFFVDRGRST